MNYSRICHNCLTKSDAELEFCPKCGTEKNDRILNISLFDTAVFYFLRRIPRFKYAEVLVRYILNLVLFLLGIFLYELIFEHSRLLWIFFILYSIPGIMRGISLRFHSLRNLYIISLRFIAAYIGAGMGCLLYHPQHPGLFGDYYPSDYFTPKVLYNELAGGNVFVIVLFAVLIFLLVDKINV
jgi:hypothetical protein